jgi:amino acid efflux transporter
VVCLIGGAYVAELLRAGDRTAFLAAGALLALVLAMRLAGARTGVRVQLALVGLLVALVVLAVGGAAPSARAAYWHPFAPHGWGSIARAASPLMLAFVGWEAAAPLTARLRDPRRQLPRVVGAAFAVTAVLYLALAAATVGVLGPRAGSSVPLAGLLEVAVGGSGRAIAAAGAVVLTLAATNAYLTGATAMASALAGTRRGRSSETPGETAEGTGRGRTAGLVAAIAATGGLLVGTAQFVAVPTALFLVVYLGCMAAAVRILSGPVRVAAAVACVAVVQLLLFSGWAALLAAAVAVTAAASEGARRSVLQQRRRRGGRVMGDGA